MKNAFALALSASVLLFATLSATIPNEWQENHLTRVDQLKVPVSVHDLVFNSPIDAASRRRWLPLSGTLVLSGLNIYEGLKIDDPDKIRGRDFVFRIRGRDLNGAILDFANLSKVDFTGADLQGASLLSAQLQGASLRNAQLQGAQLGLAQLQGATLDFAKLQGASLVGADLQGAALAAAHLQGAHLGNTKLQGASAWRMRSCKARRC